MRTAATVVALCMLAVAGCGDDGDSDGGGTAQASGTDLRVTVRSEGPDGEAATHTVRCESASGKAFCRRLSAKQLAPVPDGVACTQIFGGPAIATVEGTLHGEPVNARFDLASGCEIARWKRNAALLGQPPGNPPG